MVRKQEAGENERVMSYKQIRESKPEAGSKIWEEGELLEGSIDLEGRPGTFYVVLKKVRGHKTTILCGVTTEVPLERKARHTTCLYRSTL
jgi:hypothetical protein